MVNQRLKDGRALREPALVASLPEPASGLRPTGDDPARVPTFTPQPWDWEGTPQFAGGGFHCYLTDANGRKIGALWGPSAEKISNARLIARAPRLYEALDLLVDAYRHAELEDADFAAAEALLNEIVRDGDVANKPGVQAHG